MPLIERFLADMADRSGARNPYVIGHSMGTRGFTLAIRNLATEAVATGEEHYGRRV